MPPPPAQILSISCSFGGNLTKLYVVPPSESLRSHLGEILDPPLLSSEPGRGYYLLGPQDSLMSTSPMKIGPEKMMASKVAV